MINEEYYIWIMQGAKTPCFRRDSLEMSRAPLYDVGSLEAQGRSTKSLMGRACILSSYLVYPIHQSTLLLIVALKLVSLKWKRTTKQGKVYCPIQLGRFEIYKTLNALHPLNWN